MEEEWKDIPGYEGLYQASSLGRIKSLPRNDEIPRWKGYSTIRKQFIKNKYYQVNLSKNGRTRWHAVHRLVALAFLPNPNNYPQVNHKDEIQTNNNVSNLEWCDQKYNMNYGTVKHRISHSKLTRDYKTKVIQIKDGKPIAIFNSSYDAQRKTGIEPAAICKVCRGIPKYKTAGGYEWRRVNIGDPILFNLTR